MPDTQLPDTSRYPGLIQIGYAGYASGRISGHGTKISLFFEKSSRLVNQSGYTSATSRTKLNPGYVIRISKISWTLAEYYLIRNRGRRLLYRDIKLGSHSWSCMTRSCSCEDSSEEIHALLSHSTHFWHVPRSFGKVIFFNVDFICSEPSPHMREAMFQRILVDLSWLLRAYRPYIGLYTNIRTDRRTENTKRQDLFREIKLNPDRVGLQIGTRRNISKPLHEEIYLSLCH